MLRRIRRESAQAVSKVWFENSDGEHSRLLLLFSSSSRKREHVWREFGNLPERNFPRSDFLHGLGQFRPYTGATRKRRRRHKAATRATRGGGR